MKNFPIKDLRVFAAFVLRAMWTYESADPDSYGRVKAPTLNPVDAWSTDPEPHGGLKHRP